MGDKFTFKLNIAVECSWSLLGREDVEIGKKPTEVLALGEKRSSLRLSGGSVQPGRGPRLDSLTLWAIRRLAEPSDNHSQPP